MASSSGTSCSPATTSEADAQNSLADLIDPRKRKRMESNRESARRSRMRKQKHLDDLTAQILHLKKENDRILSGIKAANQHLATVEADNSILRAQVAELSQRLVSLDEILNLICSININGRGSVEGGGFGLTSHVDMGYARRLPIMSAGYVFQG